MTSQLRCRCGAVRGHIDTTRSYSRAVCYCKDCQAFARFLGDQDEILNANGGTEILAMLPAAVHFTEGVDRLACMSMSENGILRWYANCCRTPIGNTPRDQKIAYVGVIRACLPTLDKSAGSLKIALNTASAKGEVRPTLFATFFGVLRIMKNIIGARLNGRYKDNPFFAEASGEPIRTPHVLDLAARNTLRGDAS